MIGWVTLLSVSLIHQHCFEDGGGPIEIELQLSPRALLFREGRDDSGYNSMLHVMDRVSASKLIAR